MAQLNDLLVVGSSNLLGAVNAFEGITAPTFTGALTGNASSATKLLNKRTFSIAAAAGTNAPEFDGTANAILNIPQTINNFVKITSTEFVGRLTGNADSATLLKIHNNITNNATRSTAVSTWTGAVTMTSYVWGQSWVDTRITSDSGDLQLGLRPSAYATGGTELCMMIDGDYYSMGKKVAHGANSSFSAWTAGTTAGPKINLSLGGVTLTSAAVPSAGTGASGIVTTGAQSFAGAKTFTGGVISTYSGPAFYGNTGTGVWSYVRLQSGSTFWDLATRDNDTSGAMQFRPQGAGTKRFYITTDGNATVEGTYLGIGANKIQLTYVEATESLDFIFA